MACSCKEYLALTLSLGPLKVACLSADKTPLQVRKGSSLQLPLDTRPETR
jgi:hypothetical protein